ncbi:HTH domain-containing protein [Microbacterium sp. X-17]|uniref:HTH domain-containing protein n=1 Tax=Microbacterium sp. X-17 TaxID=3144404 RepID=UPI0031F5CEDA
MGGTTFNTVAELRRIVAEGRVSQTALEAITGIAGERLGAVLEESNRDEVGMSAAVFPLSSDESIRLSGLAAQLTQGMEIGDDERLKAILEGLTIEFALTTHNIALLTATNLDDIEACLVDPAAVAPERKYRLAVRASYLSLAIANARPY